MHILYVIHAFPWNEMTGALLVLDNYVKQAVLSNIKVSIMVPENAYKNIEHSEYGNTVSLYSFKSQENWAINGFDFSLLNEDVPIPGLDGVPDLVHIIDWVGFHPALHPFLRGLGCPIVRSVCNFEEFCPQSSPVFYGFTSETCATPLKPEQCLDCVADNHQFSTAPGVLYTYKVLMRDLATYRKNYQQVAAPLLSLRTAFVRNLFKNFVDFTVFPSASFGQYFLDQLQIPIDFKVIPHGLSPVGSVPLRESVSPIRIIYTGGGRANKGWDVMAGALEILAREPNLSFEIHCTGNGDGIPEHYFQNQNIKLIRAPAFYRHQVAEVLSAFDIAIVPSRFETYGLFVRECVQSRVVPIVTPSMGVSEFIVNGVNGFQIERPYSKNLANVIIELSANADTLTALRAGLDVSSVPTLASEFGEMQHLYRLLTADH